MSRKYSEVNCLVSIRLNKTDNQRIQTYLISRQGFNELKVGYNVRLLVSEIPSAKVIKILEASPPEIYLVGCGCQCLSLKSER